MERSHAVDYINYRVTNDKYSQRDIIFIIEYIQHIHNVDVNFQTVLTDFNKSFNTHNHVKNMLKHVVEEFKINSITLDNGLYKYY